MGKSTIEPRLVEFHKLAIRRPPATRHAVMDTEFAYVPLPEGHLRILDLYPGVGSEPLALSLSIEPLATAPYTAVSYCWARNERPHRVACGYSTVELRHDSMTVTPASHPSGYLRITDSLRDLLLAVRKEDAYLRLWVDALCINQDDLAEKATQVQQMDRIYRGAHATLVYLGEWGRDTDAAWRCAGVLSHMKNWSTEEVQKAICEIKDVEVELDDGTQQCFREMWHGFTHLLSHDWFGRVWVIQEIILSRNIGVYCGRNHFPWELLVDACITVQRHDIRPWDPQVVRCANVLSLERRRRGHLECQRLLEENRDMADWAGMAQFAVDMDISMLQVWTRECHATDPRDKIFALLGIGYGERDAWPPVDYTTSVPHVYCQVAESWFRTQPSNPLNFLTCVSGPGVASDMPSWVPDWRETWRGEHLGRARSIGKGASGNLKCLAAFPDISSSLTLPLHLIVRGARLLTVMATESLKLPRNQWRDASHARLINKFEDPYPTTNESYLDAFAKAAAPQASQSFDNHSVRTEKFWDFMVDAPRIRKAELPVVIRHGSLYVNTQILAENRATSLFQRSVLGYRQEELYEKLPSSYIAECPVAQESLIRGRKWFISNEGFMGLVPDHTLPGDQICLFFGGKLLYVVRPLRSDEQGRRIYKFIGECFVYGLMDGEATDELPDELVGDIILE